MIRSGTIRMTAASAHSPRQPLDLDRPRAPGREDVVHDERDTGIRDHVTELLRPFEVAATDVDGVELGVVTEADRQDVGLPLPDRRWGRPSLARAR